jgi:hypothetical protein
VRRRRRAKECTTDAPLPGPTRRVAVVVLKRPVAMSPRSVSRSYINHTVKGRDVRSTGRHGRIEPCRGRPISVSPDTSCTCIL